jgi:hypothetical protein
MNPDLVSLCLEHPCVHIVTRQSYHHHQEIVRFLRAAGIPAGDDGSIPVHHANKGGGGPAKLHFDKESVILPMMAALAPGSVCVFVDDTLAEVLAEGMRSCTALHRVVFASTDFTLFGVAAE